MFVADTFATNLQHANELTNIVTRFVNGLEHARCALTQAANFEQTLDELPRLSIRLSQLQHALEMLERLLWLVQFVQVDAAKIQLDRRRFFIGRGLEALFEQRCQILPTCFTLVQSLARIQRGHVERIERENAFVITNRLLRIAHRVFRDDGYVVEQIDTRRRIRRALRRLVVEAFEFAPTFRVCQDQLEPRERPLIRGIHGEHAFEIRHRAFGIAELFVVQHRRPLTQLDLHVVRKLRAVFRGACCNEMRAIRLGQIRRSTRALCKFRSAIPNRQLAREFVECTKHNVERCTGCTQLLFFDIGELEEQTQTRASIRFRLEQHAQRMRFLPCISRLGIFDRQNLSRASARIGFVEEPSENVYRFAIVRQNFECSDGRIERIDESFEFFQVQSRQFDFATRTLIAIGYVTMTRNDFGCRGSFTRSDEQSRQSAKSVASRRRYFDDLA